MTVDLYDYPFWLAVFLGVVLLTPIQSSGLRKWLQAGLNFAFLAFLLRIHVGVVAAAVLAVHIILQFYSKFSSTKILLRLLLISALATFVIHKLPQLVTDSSAHVPIHTILSLVGFSYVALRVVDLVQYVADNPQSAPDLPSTINYLLPFHMLAAGPIQAYEDFLQQPTEISPLTFDEALGAAERIATGMFKKFVLATIIERLFLTGFRAPLPYLLIEVQLNCIWLFLDFSAYSDIAVGVGRLLGIPTPENFNHPFRARNIVEFWERWHISLSLFIRRHLFIPTQVFLVRRLDGRFPILCASVAFSVSFLLCGLWHSIAWVWLAWGASQAVGLIACNVYRQFLRSRLGRKGEQKYLANPWIRCLAIFLNFEYFAFSLVLVTYPFAEWFQ